MRKRTVLGFALGPVATALISLVAVPVVAWAFKPEDVARYNLLQIFVSFAVLLVSLGLDQGYVRQYHETRDRAVLLRSCALPGLILFVVLSIPALFASEPLADLVFGTSDRRVFVVAVICAAAAIIFRFLSLILRMEERALAFSISQIIPKAVFLVAVLILLVLSVRRGFLDLSYAFLSSWLAAVLITGWNTMGQWRSALRVRTDPTQVRDLIRYGLPLIFAGLAYWALTAASAMALRYLSTLGELGVYSVALTFAGAAVIVQTVFSVMWAPIVYRWVAEKSDLNRVDDVMQQVLAVVTALFVCCGAFSWLTDVVLPSTYDNVKYLVVAAVLQPLLYTLSEATGVGVNITRRTIWSVWCTLLALAVSVGLNLALVPAFGSRGAVIANTIAYLAFFMARTEASVHTWRRFPRRRLYMIMVLAVTGAISTLIWGPASGLFYALVWAAATPIVLWTFREQWHQMLRLRRVAASA